MKTVTIEIQGPPTPQPRPRFRRMGKFVSTYDPLSKQKEKLRKEVISVQYNDVPISSPIKCFVYFYMPIPKSVKSGESDAHVKRPDIDNLIKYTWDLLAGIVYEDDKQIYYVEAIKLYAKRPRTSITFKYEE